MTVWGEVSVGSADDVEHATEVLVWAFQPDRMSQHIFTNPDRRPRQHRKLFRAYADHAVKKGEMLIYGGAACRGVALWWNMQPTIGLEDANEEPSIGGVFDEVTFMRYTKAVSYMELAHPAGREYAYLPFLGVTPEHQGTGVGTALMEYKLSQLRRTGTPAVLDATSDRSRNFYTKLGFRVHASVKVPDGPVFHTMFWTHDGRLVWNP